MRRGKKLTATSACVTQAQKRRCPATNPYSMTRRASRRGLLRPIVLDAEGRILDGRNRLAACEIAGVEPDFITYADGDPNGYALAVNIARRHLKPWARHLVMEMARRVTGEKKRKIALSRSFDEARLTEAGVVLDYAPDLTENFPTPAGQAFVDCTEIKGRVLSGSATMAQPERKWPV